MDITGTIIQIMPAQSGTSQRSGNTWMRQEYVLEVPGSYPRHMAFTIFGEDRIKQFNLHQGEQNITIQFDIDAHEYNGRWYNEIRAYNIIRPYVGQPAPQAAAAAMPAGSPAGATASPFPPQDASQAIPAGQPVPQTPDDLPF